jgi:hypothetical protein
MAADMNVLSERIASKSFADCSVDELRKLTSEYPYFAPAHFMLLKKLDPSTEAYREQYQKAILYFHDPFSFEYFINRSSTFADLPEIVEEEIEVKNETTIENAEMNATATTVVDLPKLSETKTEDEMIAAETVAKPAMLTEVQGTGDLSFEPFHTVDYFASQGIKLSQEDASGDKFGRQLKSFTDWLKTMKKLPAAKSTLTDRATEQKVEDLADHSVQAADVVTEAMAEVWLKQGNRDKAIEVYHKLSLSDPSKSAYFAAKIESLKQ